MADEVMRVDERLARLEKTVAEGFYELNGRVGRVEGRFDVVEGRLGWVEGRLDAVEGRLGAIERRMDRLEDRLDAMNEKLDVVTESLEGKIRTVLDYLVAFRAEMRRTTTAMRKEHRADRRLMYAVLHDHTVRLRALEGPRSRPPARGRRPHPRITRH
jgi:uncharacterized coiled-coil protein SlyX